MKDISIVFLGILFVNEKLCFPIFVRLDLLRGPVISSVGRAGDRRASAMRAVPQPPNLENH